jgi:uncharacterized protein (TIGR02757 family)
MKKSDLKGFLDRKVDQYNNTSFIKDDPISIPHLFTKKQDIEIAGFLAATFSWGNRTTIINKSKELMQLMDNSPHQFITQHAENDLKSFLHFKHRTFNTTDLLYFIHFLQHHYKHHKSLESAFFNNKIIQQSNHVENALTSFHTSFFSLPHAPARTRKHISTPSKHSACKRLNMYLRWMVRNDKCGVDFGIWKKIKASELICPLDVHVARVARHFNLLERKPNDWKAAEELTANLRILDADDPVKYDFALFGLGVIGKF